ncbi:MAG: oxygen-independent coproporphyrinogen III oxidase [Alphaproteobacteria bacterium]
MPMSMTSETVARWRGARLPRYTSYPTAPHFTDAVDHTVYGRWLAGIGDGTPLSLYVHVPFCRAMCWYCGCHTKVSRKAEPVSRYVGTLEQEARLVAGCISTAPVVRHLHFGGGTPTIMQPDEMRHLMTVLRTLFQFADDGEVALEIDPRTLTSAMADVLADCGFTRASLGVQSFDPAVQTAINRLQTPDETSAAVSALRTRGVTAINFDLIYGLPHQSVESCRDTVARCLAMAPDRLAVFGYAHVPDFKKHQQRIDPSWLPDGGARQDQAEAIATALSAAGYVRIGLDHYALPDDPLARAAATGRLHRNFQGYTVDDCETLIGLGASAIGRTAHGYVQNHVPMGRYAAHIADGHLATARGYQLSAEDRLRGDLIERIMCDMSVDVAAVCRRHGRDTTVAADALSRLQPLAADGIVRLDGNRVSVAEDAWFLVRAAAAAFDAYLPASPRQHSRAV